ncbi:MAG TPA: cupin domain-containing protein [Solirubrobacterales bacterium]|nr:cupin domain-containing protein [Solirubrobacterales bacterium]
MRRINIAAPQFEYDADDPDGFRSGLARLGKLLGGAEESGISVYELPPGQAVCPYHYECGEEEWLLVLAGEPTLRHPGGSERLAPWDVVFFEKGPGGAHGIRNETEETVRVLMFSTVVVPTATVYPDSDKVGIWTGDHETDVMVRRESRVEYFDRE